MHISRNGVTVEDSHKIIAGFGKIKIRRFRIDTEVRCVGAHPPFWPLEPARVKHN